MKYACADIHGCYDKYLELLEAIDLQPDDTLYIIGDMIDRGPDGVKILLDVAGRSNVIPLLGNHELMAAQCLKNLLKEITEETLEDEASTREMIEQLNEWMHNGGETTLKAFHALNAEGREKAFEAILDLDAWAEVEAGGNRFLLVHSGLSNFNPELSLDEYDIFDLTFGRPKLGEDYFPDKYVIFGHTPTPFFFAQDAGEYRNVVSFEKYPPAIYRKGKFIAIDCGCCFGGKLGCIRLDDFQEYYV